MKLKNKDILEGMYVINGKQTWKVIFWDDKYQNALLRFIDKNGNKTKNYVIAEGYTLDGTDKDATIYWINGLYFDSNSDDDALVKFEKWLKGDELNESKKSARKYLKESFEYDGAIPLEELMNILDDEWKYSKNSGVFGNSSHWDDKSIDEGKYIEISAVIDFNSASNWGFNNKRVQKLYDDECNKIYRINLKNSSIKDKLYNQKAVYYQNFEKQWDEFDKLILNLSYEEQLIFTLYYKDKYSCDEISKIIKMKKSTVKSKLVRGREKLKKYIEEENIYLVK